MRAAERHCQRLLSSNFQEPHLRNGAPNGFCRIAPNLNSSRLRDTW